MSEQALRPSGYAPPSSKAAGVPLADTIVALATPPGKGAIAVVRVSGARVREFAALHVRTGSELRPRVATYATIVDETGHAVDRGLALLFPGPYSYTGEDVLELHVHGSPAIVREVVRALLASGARQAAPGEFTRRAFLNGKMDLHEAGAVADVIDAETRSAARAALANLGGGLASAVGGLRARLTTTLEQLSGAIDFPEEVPEPDRHALHDLLESLRSELLELRRDGERGRLIREGVGVAIVGPPNAGKSSLLNALLGEERALVSEIPGTTRDTIEESIVIGGVPVRLIDTAGIRAHADRLESAGIERSRRALEGARVAVVVVDGSRPLAPEALELLESTRERPRVVFLNKADVGTCVRIDSVDVIAGSSFDPGSLAALRNAIARAGWGGESADLERPHLATLREFEAVNEALEAIEYACETLERGDPADLCSGELSRAFSALGHVTERVAAEEVLDGVFSRFCIGK
ncbi:MAG: tRNA uridine-5-carboxymethylaminomethyl(34) synthesis GTPase MnmE [Candidatus Eremiobacteraeota bacterium]|nr:tRNA uridine-5-carboxymethylaminomethyl(34) synthesis GTPase MnmE [Candidatus Eremiobacteraeota bacterium]